jgi:hypothetical protein
VPGTQVAEDLLYHPGGVNDGDHPHGLLANRAAQRVHVPDPRNQVAGGEMSAARARSGSMVRLYSSRRA